MSYGPLFGTCPGYRVRDRSRRLNPSDHLPINVCVIDAPAR